jgi:hypothetical protein
MFTEDTLTDALLPEEIFSCRLKKLEVKYSPTGSSAELIRCFYKKNIKILKKRKMFQKGRQEPAKKLLGRKRKILNPGS